MSELERFGLYFVQGLAWGSLYALIALGYTMVYGVLRLINFAHGDILMVGAYIALFCITLWHLPLQGAGFPLECGGLFILSPSILPRRCSG